LTPPPCLNIVGLRDKKKYPPCGDIERRILWSGTKTYRRA